MSRIVRTHEFRITPVDSSAVVEMKTAKGPVKVNTSDATTHMETFLRGFTGYASEDGIPTILHVYIANGKKPRSKKDNVIFETNLPDIPVAYDPTSPASIKKFISSADSPEVMKAKVEKLNPKTVDERTDYNARTMLNYLKHELAFRYLFAQKEGDESTMKIISELDVMKGFDYDVLNFVRRFNVATLNDADIEKLLSAEQNSKKHIYLKNFARYLRTHDKYEKMLGFIEEYQKQDGKKPAQPGSEG